MTADTREIIIVGAGGHATVVIDALISCGRQPAFIADDEPTKSGSQIAGITVRGALGSISAQELEKSVIVVAIAKNKMRRRLVAEMLKRGAVLSGVRHPSAIISQQAKVDPTAQIMAGVIVNAGAVVKSHAVLNTGCIVEHGASVGEYAHVGPGAVLAGAVVLEEGVFVATGAKVCPFVRLGSWSTLGAGAVALQDIASETVAVGVPARRIDRNSIE